MLHWCTNTINLLTTFLNLKLSIAVNIFKRFSCLPSLESSFLKQFLLRNSTYATLSPESTLGRDHLVSLGPWLIILMCSIQMKMLIKIILAVYSCSESQTEDSSSSNLSWNLSFFAIALVREVTEGKTSHSLLNLGYGKGESSLNISKLFLVPSPKIK